jgi:hypothetical protein
MRASRLDGGFPVGHCARCKKDVLVWVRLDERDEERRHCIHCDAELDPAELRLVEEAELDAVGYGTHAEAEHCGRPDCGAGRCGRGQAPG